MNVSSNIHRCCARGFCGSHTTSQRHSLSLLYHFCLVSRNGCLEVVGEGCLYLDLVVADLQARIPICSGA
jgi:hypothetical protein